MSKIIGSQSQIYKKQILNKNLKISLKSSQTAENKSYSKKLLATNIFRQRIVPQLFYCSRLYTCAYLKISKK